MPFAESVLRQHFQLGTGLSSLSLSAGLGGRRCAGFIILFGPFRISIFVGKGYTKAGHTETPPSRPVGPGSLWSTIVQGTGHSTQGSGACKFPINLQPRSGHTKATGAAPGSPITDRSTFRGSYTCTT